MVMSTLLWQLSASAHRVITSPRTALFVLKHPHRALRVIKERSAFAAEFVDGRQWYRHLVPETQWASYSKYISELEDSNFGQELIDALERENPEKKLDLGYLNLRGAIDPGTHLYCVIRALRPNTIVETGVASGLSSSLILKALDANGLGHLHSIDLPYQVALPDGKQTGWVVPEDLRHRWSLHIGDAKQLLPEVLGEIGELDLFFHDSLHTYEHMWFEYETAWKHLPMGGVLLSDDIFAFQAFAEFTHWVGGGAAIYESLGGIVKKSDGPASEDFETSAN